MKLNVDQNVLNFDGTAVQDEKGEDLTYRSVIELALNLQDQAHQMTAEEKLKAFQIGVRLNSNKRSEYDLTVDQLHFLKERIGIYFSTTVYGRFLELIQDESVQNREE